MIVQSTFKDNSPIFYLIGTPIGNLNDFSFRAIETLKMVDVVFCEDTRTSKKLLNHFAIKANVDSLHKFNEAQQVNKIKNLLLNKKSIALISDAGVPLISDPGSFLISELIKENLNFSLCPINVGPAFIHAQISSRWLFFHSLFFGFVPRKRQRLKDMLDSLNPSWPSVVSFYETPHRIEETLVFLKNNFDQNFKVSIAREITKLNEQFITGTIAEIYNYAITEHNLMLKGEIVISFLINEIYTVNNNDYSKEEILNLIAEDMRITNSKKESIINVAKQTGLAKNFVSNIIYSK